MKFILRAAALLSVAAASLAQVHADPVRIHVANVVARPIAAIASTIRDGGIEVKVAAENSSSAVIGAVSSDSADIAVAVRALTAQDRANTPEKHFWEETLAFQAVALIVPADVWDNGVRAITKDQMVQIYEGRIKSWKQLGGEDRPIKFYNPEQGQGVWELFATWMYGDIRKAPLGDKFEQVKSGEEARDSVEFNNGSLSVASPQYANGKGVYVLPIKDESGAVVSPTLADMKSERYPMVRPVVAIAGDRPAGDVRRVAEALVSAPAQEILAKNGLIPAVPGNKGE